MAGLDLGGDIEFRGAHDLGSASRRLPRASKVRSLGVFSLARRPRAAISADPQCCPNSDNSFSAAAPPLAATASASDLSSPNRSTSSNGGDWLSTSWVADDDEVMGRFLGYRER